MNPFEAGKIYRRVQDIHKPFGGQRQGGMSTPSKFPYVFLFTGDSGESYGYRDGFRDDGIFWYTGEGQIGDMKMDRGNLAVKEHQNKNKQVILFEYVSKGHVRCIGEATYVGHHTEERPDRNGDLRDAIVFELDINTNGGENNTSAPETDNPNEQTLHLWSRPLSEVRNLAVRTAPPKVTEKTRRVITRQRSEAVRVYVLRRANGKCEACGHNAPFQTRKKHPYLEPHHIHRLADGGPDVPDSVAAICPNCHREVHHGANGKTLNNTLSDRVKTFETGK